MHLTGLAVFSPRVGPARTVWHTHGESGEIAMGWVEMVGDGQMVENGGSGWFGWLGRPLT